MLLLTYRQPPLLTYQPRPAPKKRRPSAALARFKAEGELERRSYELERATGKPHCPKCTAMLAPAGWHCTACGHVTDSDRLLELYATAERDLSPCRGTFMISWANFWIPGVYGTVYLLMSACRENDRNDEMPIVAVSGPFVRKADAEQFREKLAAIWQFEPSVDLTDPEMWPSNQVHPEVWRAAVVWAVEQWLAPTHARH